MSATINRLLLAEARPIADDLRALLSLACERIEIAGSIRRQKPDVGDVEIVAIPRFTRSWVPSADLFAEPVEVTVSALEELSRELLEGGQLRKRVLPAGGTSWGQSLKLACTRVSRSTCLWRPSRRGASPPRQI